MDAMELELNTLESKGTWLTEPRTLDVFVIPTIWVYTYKFDEEGFLKRAKARLCVQGNKQVLTHTETRAATLDSSAPPREAVGVEIAEDNRACIVLDWKML